MNKLKKCLKILSFLALIYITQGVLLLTFKHCGIKSVWFRIVSPISHFYLFNQFIMSIPLRVIFLFLTIKYCFWFKKDYISEKNPVKNYFFGFILAFGIYFLSEFFYLLRGELSLRRFNEASYILQSLPLIMLSSIMTSYAEEIIFRTVLLNELYAVTESFFSANVLGGVVFACAHLLNPGASLARFYSWALMGIFLGYLKKTTGQVWVSTGFHSGFHMLYLLTPFVEYTGIRENGSAAFKHILLFIIVLLIFEKDANIFQEKGESCSNLI